jgi:m7GpppX diphosphatase
MLGWLSYSEDRPDVKVNVIYPATDVHIRKVNSLSPMMIASASVPKL